MKRFEVLRSPGRWTLEYGVFRETPHSLDAGGSGTRGELANNDARGTAGAPSTVGHLQVLNLSHVPSKTFVIITQPRDRQSHTAATDSSASASAGNGGQHTQPSDAVSKGSSSATGGDVAYQRRNASSDEQTSTITIHPTQADDLIQLLRTRMGPLWTSRQSMFVNNGLVYEVEDLRVRIGDLMAQGAGPGAEGGSGRSLGAAQQTARGVIVEVTWAGDPARDAAGGGGDTDDKIPGGITKGNSNDIGAATKESVNGDAQEDIDPALKNGASPTNPSAEATQKDQADEAAKPRTTTDAEEEVQSAKNLFSAFWRNLEMQPTRAYLDISPPSGGTNSTRAASGAAAAGYGIARCYCELLLLA